MPCAFSTDPQDTVCFHQICTILSTRWRLIAGDPKTTLILSWTKVRLHIILSMSVYERLKTPQWWHVFFSSFPLCKPQIRILSPWWRSIAGDPKTPFILSWTKVRLHIIFMSVYERPKTPDDMYFFNSFPQRKPQNTYFVPLMKIDSRRSQNAFHITVNQGTPSHNIDVCLRETEHAWWHVFC